MSVDAISWARTAPAKTIYERALLWDLCERVNETDPNGECWPYLRRIAAMWHCSERQMERAALALVSRGVIERHRERKPDGTWAGYRYRLPVAVIEVLKAKKASKKVAQPSLFEQPEPPDCQSNHPTGSPVDHPTGSRVMNLPKKEPESPPAPPKGATRKKIAHSIPPDWKPSDADRAYARQHHVDPVRAAEEFRNYWLGEGAAKKDWSRTFQNRVLALEDSGRFRLGNGHDNQNNNSYANY
jgi:hypothetical protein